MMMLMIHRCNNLSYILLSLIVTIIINASIVYGRVGGDTVVQYDEDGKTTTTTTTLDVEDRVDVIEDMVDTEHQQQEQHDCGVYLAESTLYSNNYALYVAKEYSIGQRLTDQELVVPVINANKNEYSPYHDFLWNQDFIPKDILLRTSSRTGSTSNYDDVDSSSYNTSRTLQQQETAVYSRDYFIAGIAAMAPCTSKPYNNVQPNYQKLFYNGGGGGSSSSNAMDENDNGVSEYHNFVIESSPTTDTSETINDGREKSKQNRLQPGQMIVNECSYDPSVPNNTNDLMYPDTVDALRTKGVCVDTIDIRTSTIPNIGRGAFTKYYVSKDHVVATSPVIHLDRSQLQMVQQQSIVQEGPGQQNPTIPLHRAHGIEYTSNIIGQQLLLNYCYGHAQSNVLLLPYGPGVNFINHPPFDDMDNQANVRIQWSTKLSRTPTTITPIMEFYEQPATQTHLLIEFVAIRDLRPGEEIFYHYGSDFVSAWNEYMTVKSSSSSSEHHIQPFRHEIGVPLDNGFYVDQWMRTDPKPNGDFIASSLSPGQMAPIRWQDTAEVVTPWAFRIGLPKRVRKVLLHYCNTMGITDILRHVTTDGNGLLPGTETHMTLEGDDWYLQRPDAIWRSNLHWFSPGAGPAHEHYLQALSAAGFDTVLEGIGDYLGMNGLVAFHVTFIGASFSNRGFLHHDVRETGAKVYNIIIPLLLANETGPELDVQSWKPDLPEDQETRLGRYRYEYDIATMVGDSAVHATSACDYRYKREMRMAATVYVADVSELNAAQILKHYTQAYPPRDLGLLKSWIGRHWKRNDPRRKLPQPSVDHILMRNTNNKKNNDNIWKASPSRGRILLSSRMKREPTVVDVVSNDTPTEEL